MHVSYNSVVINVDKHVIYYKLLFLEYRNPLLYIIYFF